MHKSRKPLPSPEFELCQDRLWVISDPVSERCFALYYEPVGDGPAYFLAYAELEIAAKYATAMTFKQEIYQTKFWSHPDYLEPLILAIQNSILSAPLDSPSHLVYDFGGTYKSRIPSTHREEK